METFSDKQPSIDPQLLSLPDDKTPEEAKLENEACFGTLQRYRYNMYRLNQNQDAYDGVASLLEVEQLLRSNAQKEVETNTGKAVFHLEHQGDYHEAFEFSNELDEEQEDEEQDDGEHDDEEQDDEEKGKEKHDSNDGFKNKNATGFSPYHFRYYLASIWGISVDDHKCPAKG
ncbi:hypothetical protein PENSTE_c008G02086 [Penicillium steckii]|uniref:Uncharacterized protein n=1 Tax=Penicillium steckii TaxID=303698 RepID=A0A1V6TB05_9EURO|nr:hypothetical protein PENSTE_c008G02086 [Penicillium steckii]